MFRIEPKTRVSRRVVRRVVPYKKKRKKKAFDEEKNDDDARGKVWKARAADATGRGGRDARRWEATSCVRPRAPAAARARGSWPPRRRAASGREPRRSPSRRPIAFHFGSDVTSVPACPPSPFAFAFDLFDRVAPTSTNRVRSTRRRSCAARVPSRADECAPRGVRALTKRSRAGDEKSKKPKTRKISIVASKMGPEILAGVWGHLTDSFRRCSQYKLPISIQATYGLLVMITFFCNTNPLLHSAGKPTRQPLSPHSRKDTARGVPSRAHRFERLFGYVARLIIRRSSVSRALHHRVDAGDCFG